MLSVVLPTVAAARPRRLFFPCNHPFRHPSLPFCSCLGLKMECRIGELTELPGLADEGIFYGIHVYVREFARVQIENEIMALREMVADQQKAINALGGELEEERNASSSATSEAMSMIFKLQREKAEIQMEERQFKAFAEERMGHDEQGLLALDDLLFKKEQAIQSLICEVQAYRHRMLSYGIPEIEVDEDIGGSGSYGCSNPGSDDYFNEYPPLKCRFNTNTGIWEDEDDMIISKLNRTGHEELKDYASTHEHRTVAD